MIIRNPNAKHHAIINSRLLEDSRLSWAARGVLAYLMAWPDGEEVLAAHLFHASPDEQQDIESALDELTTVGYIARADKAAS